MNISLYEKPMKIELRDFQLFVDGKEHGRTARKMKEMEDVMLIEPETDLLGNPDMYYMYREVMRKGTIRFDITALPAKVTEKEYNKTYGHYHPEAEQGLTYPEVYQILHGKAVFILQKKRVDGSVDVTIVSAGQGDVLFIPPNFGHVTINSGDVPLVLSNLVSCSFSSSYDEYKKNKGAAYYYLEGGELMHNPNYFVKDLQRMRAAEFNQKFGFTKADLLGAFSENPEKFGFLEKPGMLLKK
ncbi:MAG: glucose-6-phosphate isomerase family protein [Candidatus Micrarchaeota archaeon]